MFSPRLLAFFALAASAVALPAPERSSFFPDYIIADDDWFPSFWKPWLSSLFNFMPKFTQAGPTITSDDDKFVIIIHLPDYKKADMNVKVKGGYIMITGNHEEKQDKQDLYVTQFSHIYSLPTNASADDVTATISSDNYLNVTALINGPGDATKEVDRDVPIEETGKPYVKKQEPEKPALGPEEPSEVTEDDRKEPTTVSPVSEEANSIPHGKEDTTF